MISILIPVYNFEVVALVSELNSQLNSIDDKGEIIVFDDSSSSSFCAYNKQIRSLNNVIYKELDKNYGRTTIRQLLAYEAKNKWLLFLDCDSRIIHPDFLQRYIAMFKTEAADVYAGGRVYPERPSECDKRLHWKYGTRKESIKGSKTSLHTNNFSIRKEIFLQLSFPKFLESYGHEDTWIKIELESNGKKLVHISNPVEHIHIEETETLLNKTQLALQNLYQLTNLVERNILRKNVTLYKVYSNLKKFRLEFAVRLLYKLVKKTISRNLNSCKPSLLFFDFYKLYHFIKICQKESS